MDDRKPVAITIAKTTGGKYRVRRVDEHPDGHRTALALEDFDTAHDAIRFAKHEAREYGVRVQATSGVMAEARKGG